ncbi:MAG: internal scaffolding protein [Microvirus sp.]|nr:MAG: internal scaffolding protein [Microvirus sp.]
MRNEPPFLRTPYNYDADIESEITGLLCEDPSLAQQQFAEETDINELVRRFGLGQPMPENLNMPQIGDFTQATNFQESMQVVTAANQEFKRLPAKLRERFDNDPGNLLHFLEDEKNRDEAETLGLVQAKPIQQRDATQAIDDLHATMKGEKK